MYKIRFFDVTLALFVTTYANGWFYSNGINI